MDDPILRIRQQNEDRARAELDQARHEQEIATLNSIDTTIVEVMQRLVSYLDGKITKTEVVNQIESVSTPDVAKVVEAITELGIITESNRLDLSPLKEALLGLGEKLDQLPKSFPEIPTEVSVKNFPEVPEQKEIDLSPVIKAIEKIKMVAEAPNIQVDAPDLSPIKDGLSNVVKQIKAIKFPEIPKTDLSKVEKKLDTSNKILKDILEKPVGGGGGGGSSWVATNEAGIPLPLKLDGSGALQITGSITASASTLADFSVNDIEDGTTSYFGKTKPDGTWLVQKVTDTSVSYATVSNNGTVTSYTDAWTNRATLTFERFDEAF